MKLVYRLLALLGKPSAMVSALALLLAFPNQSDWPLTKAEMSGYEATSSYADVVEFIGNLQKRGMPLQLSWTGESTEKRKIPLVVVSWPPINAPGEAKKSGKPIIYVQGNIHAGEVEGKEAAQMLLRRLGQEIELLRGGKRVPGTFVDKFVFLVNPIYNADGNEKWGPVARNRPEQVGPKEVGVRPNGQGFDLNRDCIKAESPEMSAVLQTIYGKWDPDVVFDLHTTDGTRHGYDLTYSPALNPNTDPAILKFSRDEMLPSVRRDLQKQFGLKTFDYGDISTQNGKQVFSTFASEGRYVTNYGGLRNRFCILSEAVTFIPFKDRVEATDKFVAGCLTYLAKNAKKVVELTKSADAKTVAWGLNPAAAPALGVRFDFDARGEEEVIFEKPIRPRPFGRPTQLMTAKMPIIDRFKATRTAAFPAGYLLPAAKEEAVRLLVRHGLTVERIVPPVTLGVLNFNVGTFTQASSAFQGHRLITLEGTFSNDVVPAEGMILVRTAQPLGLLAFHLLEPEMTDGLIAWGFLGETFAPGAVLPVRKLQTIPPVITERVD